MNNAKVFQERNVVAICDYVSKYCELYVNNASHLANDYVKQFHNYLPTLLVHIFGSPTIRGWIQIKTEEAQNTAIKDLLSVNGHFFQALLKLSTHSEYSYDLVTDSLPNDVKKVLSSGAIHLLPRVYINCSYLVASSSTSSIDIRAAATKQSTLIPATIGGDRKIRFNMLQFYLYYFVSVPTWPPLVEPPQNNTLYRPNTIQSNTTTATKPSQYGTIRPSTTHTINTINTSTTSNTINNQNAQNNTNTSYSNLGQLRPITDSPYGSILEEYLSRLIPINSNNGYTPIVETFFLDACVELWIRTSWIVTNAKLSTELMHYIASFVKYVVRHDLKQCFNAEPSLIKDIYHVVKDEIYTLISRLALNWSKHDDYLQVINLWSVWAAPWKLGADPRSSEKQEYNPIHSGWCMFILDNLPYYITLVDIFLQRTSTFLYKDSIQTAPNVPLLNPSDSGTINGQLRIVYRLINVLKANGLVEYLGLVENAFLKLQSSNDLTLKQLAMQSYGSDKMDKAVYEKLIAGREILGKLEGTDVIWKPKGLYTREISPRSESLLKTLNALNTAILTREDRGWSSQSTKSEKSAKYAAQLKEAYSILYQTFKVVGNEHLNINTDSKITNLKLPTQSPNSTVKTIWVGAKYVGQKGYLTEEEIKAIRDGKVLCSYDNIPALGERAISLVRSYEIGFMVRWTIRTDVKLNNWYNQRWPKEYRAAFFPEKLTLRPLATQEIFYSLVALLLLVLYLFKRMIF